MHRCRPAATWAQAPWASPPGANLLCPLHHARCCAQIVLGLAFSVVAPLVPLASLGYFCTAWLVWRYALL